MLPIITDPDPMTYSDAQLVVLSAASQRDDGLLPRPAKLVGAALRSFEASLVKAGAAEPIPVQRDQPAWRLGEAEMPIGMRITAAALAVLGIEPAEPTDDHGAAARTDQGEPNPLSSAAPAAVPLRVGTKRTLLVQLLSAAEGARIETLVAALKWQPHTVRAALTRLRQDGFAIVATKDVQKRTLYRIDGATPEGTAAEEGAQ